MKVSSLNQQPIFKAKPLSQWQCKGAKNNSKNITIIALEKKDLNFIKKMIEKADNLGHKDILKQDMIDITIRTIHDVLASENKIFNKVKLLLALHDDKPCGMLVANIPKKNIEGENIIYSSRHNPAKNETELDWLVTWQIKNRGKIKGVGKALVGEYFRTIKKDKFRDIFVRSEVPENSYAVNFYESIGFEQLSNKRLKLFNKNSAQYIIPDYGEANDDTIPMLITRKSAQEMSIYLSKTMSRQEFKDNSVNIEDIIHI